MRYLGYAGAWGDFVADVAKINALPGTTIKTDPIVAKCVFVPTAADIALMIAFVKAQKSGTSMAFAAWDTGRKDWVDYSVNTVPVGSILLASWRNA